MSFPAPFVGALPDGSFDERVTLLVEHSQPTMLPAKASITNAV
jgi:hypothetical protein